MTFASAAELRQAYIATRAALSQHADHGPAVYTAFRREQWERGETLRASLQAMEREWDLRFPGDRQAFIEAEDRAHAAAYRAQCVADVARYEAALVEARIAPARFPWLKDLAISNAERNVATARHRLNSLSPAAPSVTPATPTAGEGAAFSSREAA